MRIEPPASVPTASGQIPVSSATALPPLLPPGVRCKFHGLRVTPESGESVSGFQPNSAIRRRGLAEKGRARRAQALYRRGILDPSLVRIDRLRADKARPAAPPQRVLQAQRHRTQ